MTLKLLHSEFPLIFRLVCGTSLGKNFTIDFVDTQYKRKIGMIYLPYFEYKWNDNDLYLTLR